MTPEALKDLFLTPDATRRGVPLEAARPVFDDVFKG